MGSTEGLRCARISVPAVVPGLRCARIGGGVWDVQEFGCLGRAGLTDVQGVCKDGGVPGRVCAVHVGVSHVHGVPPSLPRATARPRCPCLHVAAVAALFLPLPNCSLFWALLEASKGGVSPPHCPSGPILPPPPLPPQAGCWGEVSGGVPPPTITSPPPQSTPPSASTCSRSAPPPSSSMRTWYKSCWAPQVSGGTAYGGGHKPQTSYSWLCGSSQRSYSWLWGDTSPSHPIAGYQGDTKPLPSTPRCPIAGY